MQGNSTAVKSAQSWETLLVQPMDEFNQQLVANVHPADWRNPEPHGVYNLVVIGAGTAGLVCAAIAAGLGAKVALIERHLMGGDCLNVGCVPSKGVLRASRVWALMKQADRFGISYPPGVKYDFGAVMRRMRQLRAVLSQMDSARRFAALGVDLYLGTGTFLNMNQICVEGPAGSRTLTFAKAVICTGGRAAAPAIPGLQDAGFLTNETVFSLTELPESLAVIGAGPIGCELAQAFARFGSRVHLIEALHGILPREDRDAAEVVRQALVHDGVTVLCCGTDLIVSRTPHGKRLLVNSHGRQHDLVVQEILVGVGRSPNVEGLGLEHAGVKADHTGVLVNDRLQTTNPRIFAAGDICSPYKFTHAAEAMAQLVIQNALFPHPFGIGYASLRSLIIPWCTYTDPEIAHVGWYEHEARQHGVEVETVTVPLREVDRAVLDGEDQGFARIHVKKGTDKIVGATIVASHAGDLLSEITLAMRTGAGLRAIANTIHPYPTQAEVLKKAAYAWRKSTLTPTKKRILTALFAWLRRTR
ncbi:MAG: mercuric reductase [Nitrospirae bacterium]|nr:MAG: mercuric reductase [Nitrospirota bacterium]